MILRRILVGILGLSLIGLIAFAFWIMSLDRGIKARFAEKRFAPPVEFYSDSESVETGMHFPERFFESSFNRKNYRQRDFGQPIQPGDYSVWTGEQCLSLLNTAQAAPVQNFPGAPLSGAPVSAPIVRCLTFRNSIPSGHLPLEGAPPSEPVQIIAFDAEGRVTSVYSGASPQVVPRVFLEPELFAQYYGDKPVLRKIVTLGTVPTLCLNGLLAIEDSKFLEHPGISVTGLMRALLTVLRPGQRAQGGSTITQQLVKNYFLSDERTLKRKITEMAMAFLVEKRASKDEILETYINLIYMGQNGPFQVRGLAAASDHYFGKPIAELGLDQCALLVGVLNNPGYFNPFLNPERAGHRRARVLERMLELKMISPEQAAQARVAPLPSRPDRSMTEPAPYFVQSVRKELNRLGIDESDGLRVYTTLNLRAQESAHQAIRAGLDRLETSFSHLEKLKKSGKSLEASLIAADPMTGAVQALVGGRGYLLTQFNRAVDAKRQVGSVMKPFVYLTAFETLGPDGKPYTPLSIIRDQPTTHKFDGQTWTPRNYEGDFNGDIPIFWALKESINAATANLGISVGLTNVIDVSRRLGITSRIDPVPSLTLGAFELAPIEVLQAYSALAALGKKNQLTLLQRVENLTGQKLFEYQIRPETALRPEPVAELVGVMKQTVLNGTGRASRVLGFTHPAAGKTGTTNDKKDAWFAGFTPHHAAIVWVGYDDNTSHGLTGASGAVPIWANYMKNFASAYPADDFSWPATVDRVSLSPEQQLAVGVPAKSESKLEPIELIIKK